MLYIYIHVCFIGGNDKVELVGAKTGHIVFYQKDQVEPVGAKTEQIVFYRRKGPGVTGGCEDGAKYIIGSVTGGCEVGANLS